MKLAEALKMRSDLDIRLRQLGDRLNLNSKVQEGDQPSEDQRPSSRSSIPPQRSSRTS